MLLQITQYGMAELQGLSHTYLSKIKLYKPNFVILLKKEFGPVIPDCYWVKLMSFIEVS